MKTAFTFCPLQPYELERFLAYVAANAIFNRVVILALPSRLEMARAVAARHPEIVCSVQEYPLTQEYPDYYDPSRACELVGAFDGQPKAPSGIVLISGAAVPFPVMKTVCLPPIKPHYNEFQILNALGVERTFLFTLNVLESIRIPCLLNKFAGIHKGRRAFVVGNGPSLKSLDMTWLKDEITFGANKVYLGFKDWGFPFTYWGIVDDRQIELYPDEWEQHIPRETVKFFPFEYLRVLHVENGCPLNTYHTGNIMHPRNFIDPRRAKHAFLDKHMFSSSPDVVYLGHTVTYMLLQIAAVMGCNPIYLIGADHRFAITQNDIRRGYWTNERGENHFHAGYSVGKQFNLPESEKAEAFFDHAAQYGREQGFDILNATPGTALKSFPLVRYETLFSGHSVKSKTTLPAGASSMPAQAARPVKHRPQSRSEQSAGSSEHPVCPPASPRCRVTSSVLLPYLIRARLRTAKQEYQGRCYIFGAGKHTAWLKNVFGADESLPEVMAVLDDHPEGGIPFGGTPLIQAGELVVRPDDYIILSSDCHQARMAARCRELFGSDIKLVDLYEGLPPGPYQKDDVSEARTT